MVRGNHEASYLKRINSKILILILSLVLVLGCVVSGTVAWLISTPDPVVNTFTYGDINITLTETDTGLDNDNNLNTNQYEMVPGQTITKDPVITVINGSEEMWLFVKLEKSANFDTFMEYAVDGSWAELPGVDGVYYRHITAEEVESYNLTAHVLADNAVIVKDSVTKEMLNALDADGTSNYPTLTVTAYAVQYAGNASAADAWSLVSTDSANP